MKVLIADDDPTHRKLLRASLRTLGHESIEAADGIEILELLTREKVDAVISDILMPNMDGYRVCAEVRKTAGLENTPIILYSSTYQSPGDRNLALKFGASVFLEKPAPPEVLESMLRSAIARPRPQQPASTADELGTLKQYSDRLVTKIEEKNLELQKTSEELRSSEETFRQFAENIQEVFWMVDLETSRMIYVSPAYERIWGRKTEELYQNPEAWQLSVHGEDLDRVRRFLSKLTPDSGAYTVEYRILRPDRSVRWIVARGFPVRDSSGRVYRVAGIAQDVTERRNLEQQFLQAQKMEAVGRLAGGVAHDFNNLLTAILGYSQLALEQVGPQHALHHDLREIIKAGDRAAGLTRQLLSFSRKQFLQPRVVDVNTVVTDIERLLRRLIGEDVEVAMSLNKDLPHVRIDPGQLEQVIVNLCVNARDAMPNGGRLAIETAVDELDPEYCRRHPEISPGTYVRLAIGDSGTGMTEETKAHLFEPFFTTKEAGKGTGLGLATVHGIIKQSGGHIGVYSELGRGSTFKIYLPPIDQEVAPTRRIAPNLDRLRGAECILLVEDDPLVRTLSTSILTRSGYKVLAARRGEEALMVLGQVTSRVDLLFTDLVMPGMNGIMLARAVLSSKPGTRLLFTSGYTDTSLLRDGFLNQETPFLGKPFTPESLLRKVREALDSSPQQLTP